MFNPKALMNVNIMEESMSKKKSRKRKEKTIEKSSREVDNTRGSKLWAFNHFRSPILTSLLNDLVDLEAEGLDDPYCKKILSFLDYSVNYATEFSRGGFMTGPIYKEIEGFRKFYFEWNEIRGSTEKDSWDRRKYLGQLRAQRQRISNKARRLQYELDHELDQKLLADTYRAIGELINLVPNLFKNLAHAYNDYLARGGFINA
jgi:hypothetical protein